MQNLPPSGELCFLICPLCPLTQILCDSFEADMTTFTLPLKSCLPSAVRNLILQKKTNIRNVSSTAGDEWG